MWTGPSPSTPAAPSSRMPVPASRMPRGPPAAVTSTHGVLPPKRVAPPTGTDPRTPQNLTLIRAYRLALISDGPERDQRSMHVLIACQRYGTRLDLNLTVVVAADVKAPVRRRATRQA